MISPDFNFQFSCGIRLVINLRFKICPLSASTVMWYLPVGTTIHRGLFFCLGVVRTPVVFSDISYQWLYDPAKSNEAALYRYSLRMLPFFIKLVRVFPSSRRDNFAYWRTRLNRNQLSRYYWWLFPQNVCPFQISLKFTWRTVDVESCTNEYADPLPFFVLKRFLKLPIAENHAIIITCTNNTSFIVRSTFQID